VRQYLSSFNSIAIVLTSKGSILAVPNPSGYERAWWVRKPDAARLVEASRERGDVEQAARRLVPPVILTEHSVALMRTDKALARLNAILSDAQENGDLRLFNSTYREKRLAAAAVGQSFMPYVVAQKRLKRALVEAIAAGTQGHLFRLVLLDVFK
jgi:hypothetical protein